MKCVQFFSCWSNLVCWQLKAILSVVPQFHNVGVLDASITISPVTRDATGWVDCGEVGSNIINTAMDSIESRVTLNISY